MGLAEQGLTGLMSELTVFPTPVVFSLTQRVSWIARLPIPCRQQQLRQSALKLLSIEAYIRSGPSSVVILLTIGVFRPKKWLTQLNHNRSNRTKPR